MAGHRSTPKRIRPQRTPAPQTPSQTNKRKKRSRRRSRSGGSNGFGPSRLATWAEAVGWRDDRLGVLCDACLLLTLCVTPWIIGGRIASGQLVFLFGGLASGLMLCLRALAGRGFSLRKTDLLLGLGLAVVLVQVTPLPTSVVNSVSPKIAKMLPALGNPDAMSGLPAWDRLSLTPMQTWQQLGLLTAGVIFFIGVRNRVDTPSRLKAALWILTGLGAALAMFGLLQFSIGNGRFYWFYDHPYTTTEGRVRGPFSNPNHFAGWMVLASVWPLWQVIAPGRQKKDDFGKISPWPLRAALASLFLTVPALLLTQSRSGLVTFAVAGVGVVLLGLKGRGENAGRRLAFGAAALAAVGVVSLATFGAEAEAQIEQNLLELTSADIDELDKNSGRREIWMTAVKGFQDFPVLGVGLGGHAATYRHYWDAPAKGKTYSHAENGPLQLALETGVAGLVVVGLFVLTIGVTLLKAFSGSEAFHGQRVIAGAALTFVAVHLVHVLTDFVWHSPGNMVAVLAFAAVGVAAATVRAEADEAVLAPRFLGFVGGSAVVLAAVTFLPPASAWANAEPHLFETVRLRRQLDLDTSPEAFERVSLMEMQELLAARKHVAGHYDIDGRLSTLMLRLFDIKQREADAFDLVNLQDSLRGGGWSSVEEANKWLAADGVAGANYQALVAARRLALSALKNNPLELNAWRRLHETQFLADLRPDAGRLLVAQMLAAQPHAARSHHQAAIYGLLSGNTDAAIRHWKVAFAQDERLQPLIARKLALLMPAEQLLSEVDPTPRSLHRMRGIYEKVGRPEEEAVMARALGQEWEMAASEATSVDAVEMLRRACVAYRRAMDAPAAERVGRRAVEIAPTSVTAHAALGDFYREQELWDQASEHLLWCSRMRPDDTSLRDKASFCLKKSRERQTLIANPDEVIIR